MLKFTRRPFAIIALVILTLYLLTPPSARADSIILQTCDAADLINAITTANLDTDADAIVLLSTCTGPDSYTLTTVNNTGGNGPNGLPVITSNLTIEGNGATITRSTATQTPPFRIMQISDNANVNLNNVTLRNGEANTDNGGAIYSTGFITVYGSTLTNNHATQGGAIYTQYPAVLTIQQSTIVANIAETLGGGVTALTGTILTISRSTFTQNTLMEPELGGALAIYDSQYTISNSTFSGNSAGDGSGGAIGIAAGGGTLVNNTIANNSITGQLGGGINNEGNTTMLNNIVANNSPNNCYTINDMDNGHNLDSGTSCNFNSGSSISSANPQLGPLANNGGPTLTMALSATSPAVDAGSYLSCAQRPVFNIDQRGEPRGQDNSCDIGAYEYQPSLIDVPCPNQIGTPQVLTPSDRAIVTAKPFTLDWSPVTCANRYEIRITGSARDRVHIEKSVTPSHYTIKKLKRGHTYQYQVRACKNATCSPWSPQRQFKYKP